MKKIMFNDKYGLTNAVLQGRKTMTRRMVSVPEYWHGMWVWGFSFDKQSHSLLLYDADERPMEDHDTGECAYIKPRYKIGEVVAVSQSYKDLGYTKEWVEQHISPNPNAKPTDPFEKKYPGWNNKMFTPSELNNVRKIQITDIKAERLQDISDEDVYKEGFRKETINNGWSNAAWYWEAVLTYTDNSGRYKEIRSESPKEAFSFLIDKVSGNGTWERNDWQFAYTFKLVK